MATIAMPELGETISQGTVTRWFKAVGDDVTVGEALFEVSTEKVDAEVPSPLAGRLTEIRVQVGDLVDVGAVVAVLDGDNELPATTRPPEQSAASATLPAGADHPDDAVKVPVASPGETAPGDAAPLATADASAASPVVGSGADGPVASPGPLVTSPMVRRLVNSLGADAQLIVGTGPDGRVTRNDAQKVALDPRRRPATSSPSPPPPSPTGAEVVMPFNKMRRLTGERMVASKALAPHVMTAVEVDYEAVERVRRGHQDAFRATEGIALNYLPFVCRAVVTALREFPSLNASVVDEGLALHRQIDLNIAVDLNFEGLVAPVVRSAGDKRLSALARDIADVAARARAGKLRTEDVTGGTFTLSNSGPFGTFMVAPVINQPQVAILSTDGVVRRPVVVTDRDGNEAIAIHSVGMLVLSWDHRAFDGAYAAAFVRRVKTLLEEHDWESELS